MMGKFALNIGGINFVTMLGVPILKYVKEDSSVNPLFWGSDPFHH